MATVFFFSRKTIFKRAHKLLQKLNNDEISSFLFFVFGRVKYIAEDDISSATPKKRVLMASYR